MNKKIIIMTVSILIITFLSSCSAKKQGEHEIINAGGKKITIINDDKAFISQDVTLKKISTLKDIRSFEWIDEDNILISKENKNCEKIITETGSIYPQNLYSYNLKTNEAKLLLQSENSMGNATLSPNKKNVFYKEGIESLTGFMYNFATKQKIQVTKQDSIYSTEGQWADNDNIVFSTLPTGDIFSVNCYGKSTKLGRANGIASNTMRIKNEVYYSVSEKLYKQGVNSEDRSLWGDKIDWAIPSPGQSELAVVKHSAGDKRILSLYDFKGEELKKLAEGTQIMGTSWSSDGAKLAYTVASENKSEAGLFVFDCKTEKTVQLAVDIQYISDYVKWSPSGKKMLASNFVKENNTNLITTYIIELK